MITNMPCSAIKDKPVNYWSFLASSPTDYPISRSLIPVGFRITKDLFEYILIRGKRTD